MVSSSWRSNHGRFWYDDPWYRAAWIIAPQMFGILLFSLISNSAPQSGTTNNWAAPLKEKAQPDPSGVATMLSSCKSAEDGERRVKDCSSAIDSGKLQMADAAEAYYRRGWGYHLLGNNAFALSDLGKSIAMAPSSPVYHNDLGVVLRDEKKYDDATKQFDTAIALNAEYARAYSNRGYVLYLQGKYADALKQADLAIAKNGKTAWGYRVRAEIYEALGDWQRLFDDANKYIELSPNDGLGYTYRGRAYFELKQYEPAKEAFTKAISLDDDSFAAYTIRGRIYFLQGEYDRALADYNKALQIDANASPIKEWTEELRSKMKR